MLEFPLQEDKKLITSLDDQGMTFKNGSDERKREKSSSSLQKRF